MQHRAIIEIVDNIYMVVITWSYVHDVMIDGAECAKVKFKTKSVQSTNCRTAQKKLPNKTD